MRLEARSLEGDRQTAELVPLRSLIEFKEASGHGVDWWIRKVRDPDGDADATDWEPRLVWQTLRDTIGEERTFEEWLADVDWCGVYAATDVLDPSGGEETQTPESSPASSSAPAARGASSSRSTKSSKPRSGSSSEA